jgi:hypothetical protein
MARCGAEGVPEFGAVIRAPLWLIVLLLLAAIGIGVYAYFTTPLPLGLSSVIRTPGGEAVPVPGATSVVAPPGSRTPAGRALALGATSVTVQSVLRNQDLAGGGRSGPVGSFTVVDIIVQNAGTEPVTPRPTDFRLMDDRGRVYAVDAEATRSVNANGHRRVLFDASVPPTGSLETLLAFETPADATPLLLRVTLGYGDLELPR